jgi:polyhydroxyalkanoate synthesis regulator phasin
MDSYGEGAMAALLEHMEALERRVRDLELQLQALRSEP